MHNSVQDILKIKKEGRKISVITSYDYTLASLCDKAGIDVLVITSYSIHYTKLYDATLNGVTFSSGHHVIQVFGGDDYYAPTDFYLYLDVDESVTAPEFPSITLPMVVILGIIAIVITSYSIHYTKLYEHFVLHFLK